MKIGLEHTAEREVYRQYLRRIDARALLEHYGAQNCTEQINHSDGTTEIVHSCLLDRVEPHHTNGDASPSASCNIDKKSYVCYSMGFGCDLFHLVMKLEGKESFSESLSAIGNFLTESTVQAEKIRRELDALFTRCSAYQIDLPSYDGRVIAAWETAGHPYWAQRQITPEAISALRLGYDEHEHRIVFPHFVNETLVGWQKRVIPAGPTWRATVPDYPKYRNSPGFPKSETLYNLDTACDWPRVCVVESPMSVARAVSLGIPNVVATFGAKVSSHQIELLTDFNMVYVWFDHDEAGLAGERKLVEGLYRHTDVKVITPEGGKDMGDADIVEIIDKIEQALPAALRLGQYGRRKKDGR